MNSIEIKLSNSKFRSKFHLSQKDKDYVNDKGIDIIIDNNVAVQCKAYKNKVPPAAIRDLLGTLQNSGYKKGILASTNGFTTGVSDYIKNNDIKLMTAEDYVKLQNKL